MSISAACRYSCVTGLMLVVLCMLAVLLLPVQATASEGAVVDFVIDENDILEWTGDTDTDPRCLVLLSDDRLVFFEDEPGAGAAEDAVILVDPTLPGTERFSVIASEDELLAAAPNGTKRNAHVSDIVRDSQDSLYLLVTERSAGNYDNYVMEIPCSSGNFGAPLFLTDVFDGGNDGSGRVRHRVEIDATRGRLYILYDNLDAANETDASCGSNGIYTFDLASAPGTTSDLAMFASYVEIGAAVTPPADNGREEMGLWQIRADSQGNLLGVHCCGTGGNDGDVVKVDAASGQVSLFLDQQDAESATGNLHQFTASTNLAIQSGNDHVYLFETGTTTEQRENVYEFDATGNLVDMVVAHDQVVDALLQVGPTFTTTSSNPMAVGGAGDVYFFLHNSHETLVSIDGGAACDPAPPLSFIWPTGSVTPPDPSSPYGPRQLASAGYRYDWHRGVDIAMPLGTPLFAVADGVVEDAGDLPGFSEPLVILRHGQCPPYVYSYYLHMSGVDVQKEEQVVQGEMIGVSGQSASGFEHVHYEVRKGCNSQSCSVNPLEVLPYLDETPSPPSLAGANLAADQTILVFDISTPDSQIDLNGTSIDWGTDSLTWNWIEYNRANSPGTPSALDRPVIDFGGGKYAVVFPAHMNASSSSADYRVAFAGLDPGASSGTATVNDLRGPGVPLNLEIPAASVAVSPPSMQVAALPGETVTFDHGIENKGADALTLHLKAQSASNNDVLLSASHLRLKAGASRVVTVTLILDPTHPEGTGDGVVLEVDAGGATTIVALDTACWGSTCLSSGD